MIIQRITKNIPFFSYIQSTILASKIKSRKGDDYMKKLLLAITFTFLLVACGGEETNITTNDIIEQFKSDGLEIGEVSDLDNKEYGNTRKEGKRILVPSLGEDTGGRLFIFKDEDGLKKAKKYYDDLGNASPIFYSHTYQNGLILLQMNGDMSDEDFEKFKASINKLVNE